MLYLLSHPGTPLRLSDCGDHAFPPNYPFAVSPKNSIVHMPIPHSSTRNSFSGTSVEFGAASPLHLYPHLLKAEQEKCFIFLLQMMVLFLSNLSILILWLLVFLWLGFAFLIGNYKLNLICGPPSSECIIHSCPCFILCLASLHSIHIQYQSLQELGRGIRKHNTQLLFRIFKCFISSNYRRKMG